MHVVNENENRNENTCKNEEKTLTKILKTKTKTIIESKTKLLVKTKIVQLTENSHSVFSVQQVDSVQPSSSNRAKPALPEAKFTLFPILSYAVRLRRSVQCISTKCRRPADVLLTTNWRTMYLVCRWSRTICFCRCIYCSATFFGWRTSANIRHWVT